MNPDYGSESGLLDIELTESGGLRVFLFRGTEILPSNEEVVVDAIAVAYTQRLLYWAGQLAARYGYRSMWTLGFRINGIAGLKSYAGSEELMHFRASGSMEGDVYSSVCTVASNSLNDSPEPVVKSLVGRLLRVLGSASAFE